MIPALIAAAAFIPSGAVAVGAVAVGAGVACALNSDDKSNQTPKTEKQQVSEDYVAKQLARAGKDFGR